MYKLFVPKQAVGASLIYFDLFNATGSGATMKVYSVRPTVSGAVAVVGVLGVDLFLQRTTAIGTGGTAATSEGSSQTAATFAGIDVSQVLDSVTARLTPTGGATAGAVIGWSCVFTEEISDATYVQNVELVRNHYADLPPITVQQGSGISVVQGTVASVGNIGFNVVFDVLRK